jgi:hypothetical protein
LLLGKIETEMGNMKVDVSLRPEEKNRFRVKAGQGKQYQPGSFQETVTFSVNKHGDQPDIS